MLSLMWLLQPLWQPLLQLVILTSRPFRSGAAYKSIWNEADDESPQDSATQDSATQVSIANHLATLAAPTTTGCKYSLFDDDDLNNEGYQFNVFYVNCPLLPDRGVYVSFTDSPEGWANTVEHCANVQMNEIENNDLKEKIL